MAAQWDIVNESGVSALSVNSFISCDISNSSRVVSSPVESGGFASYNKVHEPVEINVSVGINGTDEELQTELNKVKALKEGLDLLSVITPEAEYKNLNLTGYSYRRQREDGLTALWLDLEFQEIRTVTAEYSSARLASKKSTGSKQTKETSILASLLGT